jgi:DNA primase
LTGRNRSQLTPIDTPNDAKKMHEVPIFMNNKITDEIKSKIDIVELISEYLQLKPAGINFKSLCPFHQEKTPSFFVSPERQIWHCFGCGAGGSIFDFVMKMEGIEFPEALRILAKKAGVVLKKEDPQTISQKTRLLDICQLASRFYHYLLTKTSLGAVARDYLKSRQITSETIEEFQLGYAPNSWETIGKFLQQRGFKLKEILASGLIVQKSDSDKLQSNFYDRFRNRLIFPLADVHGSIVGFAGRILDYPTANLQSSTSKYINTPQTLIYHKGCLLYGLDKAKQAIREKKSVIVVEGQMDVLASHQVGIKNVVASSGTALTLDQIKLIKRFAQNLILAFDIDPAGFEATKRGIEIAWQEGMEVKIATLPEGKDPDELIRKDLKLWQRTIENARPVMEYYFENTFRDLNLSKVEDKKKAAKVLLPLIAKLEDKIEQDFWLKKIAEKLDVQEQFLREEVNRVIRQKSKIGYIKIEGPELIESSPLKDRSLMLSERLIGLLLKYSEELEEIIQNLKPEIFPNLRLREIAEAINSKSLSQLKPSSRKYLSTLSLLVEKEFSEEISQEEILKEAEMIWLELKKINLWKKSREIEKELKKAEEEKKSNRIKILSEKFEKLTRELKKLEI